VETAIALDPNNVVAVRQLGYTLMHLGDPEAAIPIIEKGIRLSPYDAGIPGAYQVLGLCHLFTGHMEQAIGLLKKVVRRQSPSLFARAAADLAHGISMRQIPLWRGNIKTGIAGARLS